MNHDRQRFPHLGHLCLAYFHQDWALDARDSAGIVEIFASESPANRIAATIAELRALLESQEMPDLDRLLHDLSCQYLPAAEGLTAREWLRRVVEQLEGAAGP